MLEHSDRLVTCQPSIGIAESIQFLEVGRIPLRGHRRWRYPPQHLGWADALWQLSELHQRRDSEDQAMSARLLAEALEILDAVPRELNPWLRVRLARRLAQTLFEAADARRGVQARAWKWTLKRLSKQLPTGTDLHGQSEVLARAAPALTEIHREIFDGDAP